MDIKSISPIFYHVPLVNSVVVMKEFLLGIYDMSHIGIVLGWHIFYIVAMVVAVKYMFSREEVVFRS